MIFCTKEYYSAIKMVQLLICVTWTNLKSIMLSVRNQTQRLHAVYNSIHMKLSGCQGIWEEEADCKRA